MLVTAPQLARPGLELLEQAGCEVLVLQRSRDKAEVDELLATREVHAVVSRTIELDAAAMRSCPSLVTIAKHGVGTNNIDVGAATELGIPVTRTPGTNTQSVAELALGLMLAAARRVAWLDREARQGRWSRVQDGCQLAGRTLGLVGCGDVGRRLGEIAAALGMAVEAHDPALRPGQVPDGVVLHDDLEDLLARADVLSLHVPLTPQTTGLVGRAELDRLPEGAILVNTARGPVVDEAALVDALRSGRLRAAGLDTVAVEPIAPDHPLLALDNVVITPHVGGSTTESVGAVGEASARHALTVLRGETPPTHVQVNPAVFAAGAPR